MRRAFLFLALAGCTSFPALDERALSDTGTYLDFLTLPELQALAQAPAPEDADAEEALAARLAALRARAARLRGPVFGSDDRARLTGAPS